MSINTIERVNNISTIKSAPKVSFREYADTNADNINFCADDTYSFTLQNSSSALSADTLKKELDTVKNEQGFIGKAWDGIKNLFNMKNGSDNVEKTIEKLEAGEISEDEAGELLEKYKNGQKMSVDIAGDILSGITAVGAAAFAPFTGGASLLVAASAGACVKTAIKASDACMAGREYDLGDLGYDILTGGINGAMAPLSNALGGAVGTGIAKAAGLETVETAAKTTAKGFLSKLLAKQGAIYVAKEGSRATAAVIGAKVLAYGADMAVDGALSGATDGFARALAEGRVDDIGKDAAKGALGGLIAAPLIGGGMRLTFKGANALGSKMFNASSDALSDAAADTTSREISENGTDIIPVILKELNESSNPDAQRIVAAYKKKYGNIANDVLEQRMADASMFIQDEARDVQLRQFARSLNEIYTYDDLTVTTLKELQDALDTAGEIIYDPLKNNYTFTSNKYGTFYARAKSEKSVYSKLKNKILNLDTTFPEDVTQAGNLIGDAQGSRLVINNITADELQLDSLISKHIKDASERDLFVRYLSGVDIDVPASKLSSFEALERQIYNDAVQKQSGDFVQNLVNALKNDELHISELHNYAGRNGIAYFTDKQVSDISLAYEEWFNKMLARAQADSFSSGYKMITEDGLTYLEDAFGNRFSPSLIVESPSISDNAVKASGYTASQMNIITKQGQKEELQFRGTLINDFAEYEHVPYDIRKAKITVSGPEFASIEDLLTSMDKDTYAKYTDYLRALYNAYRKQELGFDVQIPDIKNYLGTVLSDDKLDLISVSGLEKLYKSLHGAM